VLHGVSVLSGLAGYLDVYRRPAACEVSKNLRERSQADGDFWHGLFDTRAGLTVGVSSLSKKRALTVWLPALSFEVPQQPVNGRFKRVVLLPGREVGNVVFPDLLG
jgi:hypothetical protein